jgi:hypothetical protein
MIRTIALISVILLSLSGCATQTRLLNTWVDTEYGDKPVKRILVLGIAKEESIRRMYESQLTSELRQEGVDAISSFRVLPQGENIGWERIIDSTKDLSVNGILVTRTVDIRVDATHTPERTVVKYDDLPNYYRSFRYYYTRSVEIETTPSQTVETTTLTLETNLYDMQSLALIWTAMTSTVNPDPTPGTIQSLTDVLVKNLLTTGLIEKPE